MSKHSWEGHPQSQLWWAACLSRLDFWKFPESVLPVTWPWRGPALAAYRLCLGWDMKVCIETLSFFFFLLSTQGQVQKEDSALSSGWQDDWLAVLLYHTKRIRREILECRESKMKIVVVLINVCLLVTFVPDILVDLHVTIDGLVKIKFCNCH